jgi:hypothetical protein
MKLLLSALACSALLGSAVARSAVARPCEARVDRGVIPVWARSGFSDPKPRMAHVLGRSGRIVALVFGDPLHAPGKTNRNNKILWVPRIPLSVPSDLRISAQRMAGAGTLGKPVVRIIQGGPGPSIVDLPRAGCWRLSLRWAGRSDELDLQYRALAP